MCTVVVSLVVKCTIHVLVVLGRWKLRAAQYAVSSTCRMCVHSAIDGEGSLQVLGWELSDEDMAALSSFTVNTRMVDGGFFVSPHGPYTSAHDLWDE